jgi:hypothetical protein
MTARTLPRSQAARILVLDAVLHAAVDAGLPVPDVDFADLASGGTHVLLTLAAGDRAGVAAWAARLGLPVPAVSPALVTFGADRHGSHSQDVWLGFSWATVSCALRAAGAVA